MNNAWTVISACSAMGAAVAGIVSLVLSCRWHREQKQINLRQADATEENNRIAREALAESRKSPERKRADDLARRGGFFTHISTCDVKSDGR